MSLAVAEARRVKAPDVTNVDGEVTINWSTGLLTTRAGAAADLRAPTAAIARVKAERSAAEVAAEKLLDVAEKLHGKAKAKRTELAAETVVLDVTYSSDGSTIVTAGLPIESIRRVVAGPSPLPEKKEPRVLTVDARAIELTPAISLTVSAGAETYAGPMVFVTRSPSSADKAVVAKGAKDGISLDSKAAAAVAAARSAGALVVVLLK